MAVQELAVQVQSLASHPNVTQTVSGLNKEYPATHENVKHVLVVVVLTVEVPSVLVVVVTAVVVPSALSVTVVLP